MSVSTDPAFPAVQQAAAGRHPRAFAPATLILLTILCAAGAVIGMQMMVSLGITANTSVVGALIAMALARIPSRLFGGFRSIHVQNLAQSAISAATFGAGNSLLLPIGIPFVLGRPDLVVPLFIGVALAMLVDATMLYRMFATSAFPAEAAWPPGVAAAQAIRAGDEGGRRVGILGLGIITGIVGSWFAIPMSAFGVAFIGNIFALTMFGAGLLFRGYAPTIAGAYPDLFAFWAPKGNVMAVYMPHGIMIGAGLVALAQVARTIIAPSAPGTTHRLSSAGRDLGLGSAAYIGIAALIAVLGGITAQMPAGMILLFVLYAAFAALVHELIVGLAAMHSGWFPAFAVALITLIIGMLVGFPPVALALLVGFSAATGPAFADMGYDLKAGFMLRGHGADPAFESDGRFQQYLAAMFAFAVAGVIVLFSYPGYFAQGQVAPVAKVYVATINAGATAQTAWHLALWAIPGAILQLAGGPRRQLGVLFATGLLILSPMAGWAVLVGVACRMVYGKLRGREGSGDMEIFAGGAIAGDTLFGFGTGVIKSLKL